MLRALCVAVALILAGCDSPKESAPPAPVKPVKVVKPAATVTAWNWRDVWDAPRNPSQLKIAAAAEGLLADQAERHFMISNRDPSQGEVDAYLKRFRPSAKETIKFLLELRKRFQDDGFGAEDFSAAFAELEPKILMGVQLSPTSGGPLSLSLAKARIRRKEREQKAAIRKKIGTSGRP